MKPHRLKLLLLLMLACGLYANTWANGLVISNVERLEAPNRDQVRFNIAWQNSWMVGGTPGNHDAVWVFIKFKPCDAMPLQYSHAQLSMDMSDHSLSSGLAFAQPITNLDRYGDPNGHNTGVLIRRATLGLGNIVGQTVTLRIVGATDGEDFDPDTEYEVDVFGVEMVQIPEAPFQYSDADMVGNNWGQHFQINLTDESSTPTVTARWNSAATLGADFPKGVQEFYCMKYEISQGQYADFLNNIGQAGSFRVTLTTNNRFTIALTDNNGYQAGEPNRACNFLSVNDVLAYLDWAALRPMTELEYEKVCRGTGAYATNGYAWGTATLVEAQNVTVPEDGTELVSTLNATAHYSGTSNLIRDPDGASLGAGPIGCGIFARNGNEGRTTSGASFYGVMEMSGNVMELCVGAITSTTSASAVSYNGQWGDGILTTFGNFVQTGWPAAAATNYGWRGGGWNSAAARLRISDREDIANYTGSYNNFNVNTRNNMIGGRGVR